MLTQEQIKYLSGVLGKAGVKDTDFTLSDNLKKDDAIVIVQDGINKRITVQELIELIPGNLELGHGPENAYPGDEGWANSQDIEELMNEIFKLSFATFTGGGTYEIGNTVTPQIKWTVQRKGEVITPSGATVNGSTNGVSSDYSSFTGAPITATTVYNVEVKSGNQKVSRTATYSILPKKYYGVSALTSLSNSDILALNSTWATSKAMSPTEFNCTGGKYPYYCIPTELYGSGIEVWVNGFRLTDIVEQTVNVTNANGVTKSYKVIRLNNMQTGILSIEFK